MRPLFRAGWKLEGKKGSVCHLVAVLRLSLNLNLCLTEKLLAMHWVQNDSYSFSLLLPFSLKTYHFSLDVVKFYTWDKGSSQVSIWTCPRITDLITEVTTTTNSFIAVWKKTNFCEHGVDLLVTLGLSILRLHFYVTGITALRNQDPGKRNYSLYV